MSSLLEDRYRRALRMLPGSYRKAWEEDMVATFLQGAYAADPDDPEGVELSHPDRSELASIIALSVRLRLGVLGAAPRYLAWGAAARRVALVGLLAHTIVALVGVVLEVWIIQRLPGVIIPEGVGLGYPSQWQALWSLTALLWLPAYLSIVHGHLRVGRALAILAFLPRVLAVVVERAGGHTAFSVSQAYWLLFDLMPLLALAAFHQGAPRVEPRRWLLALPVGVVVTFAAVLLGRPAHDGYPLVDLPGLWCVGLCAAAAVHLVTTGGGAQRGAPHWPLALAVLATGAFGLRALTLLDYVRFTFPLPNRSTMIAVSLAEAVAVLVVVLWLGLPAKRALRALPAWPPGPAAPP
ncbi:MAG TPA: hypothetical protein VK453_16205 [Micromonosporaceae bacterium]|nr:hypothetical protein [Micromonosporaceae bacterium]